jgi:hypothetical protein
MDHLVSHLEHPDRHDNNITKLYSQLDTQLKIQLLEQALIGAKKLAIQKDVQSNARERMDRDVTLSNQMMYDNLSRQDECPSMPKVDKVVVMGCGIPSANGIYLADNNNNGSIPSIHSPRNNMSSPKSSSSPPTYTFEKEAIWNGTRTTFSLLPIQCGKFYTHYKLCARQNDQTTVLYTSPTLTGGGDMIGNIPQRGWEVEGGDDNADVEDCIYPAPLFVGRVVSDRNEA